MYICTYRCTDVQMYMYRCTCTYVVKVVEYIWTFLSFCIVCMYGSLLTSEICMLTALYHADYTTYWCTYTPTAKPGHKSQLFTIGVQCYRYIVAVSILKMLSHSDRILKQCPDCHRLQCFKNRFKTYRKNRNKILAMKQKNDLEKYVPLFLGLFNVIASIKYMMCVLTW